MTTPLVSPPPSRSDIIMIDLVSYISSCYHNTKCLCRTVASVRSFATELLINTRPYLNDVCRNEVADNLIARAVAEIEKKRILNIKCCGPGVNYSFKEKVRGKVTPVRKNSTKQLEERTPVVSNKKKLQQNNRKKFNDENNNERNSISRKPETKQRSRSSNTNYEKSTMKENVDTQASGDKTFVTVISKDRVSKTLKDITNLQKSISVRAKPTIKSRRLEFNSETPVRKNRERLATGYEKSTMKNSVGTKTILTVIRKDNASKRLKDIKNLRKRTSARAHQTIQSPVPELNSETPVRENSTKQLEKRAEEQKPEKRQRSRLSKSCENGARTVVSVIQKDRVSRSLKNIINLQKNNSVATKSTTKSRVSKLNSETSQLSKKLPTTYELKDRATKHKQIQTKDLHRNLRNHAAAQSLGKVQKQTQTTDDLSGPDVYSNYINK